MTGCCCCQEDTRRALLASLQDDPLNPWVKDISSGRTPGIPALLDWPEASDESDSEASPLQIEAASLTAPSSNEVDLSHVNLEIPGFAGFGECSALDSLCFCRISALGFGSKLCKETVEVR